MAQVFQDLPHNIRGRTHPFLTGAIALSISGRKDRRHELMVFVQEQTVKRARWMLALLALIVLLGSGWGVVQAAPPAPQTPPNSILPAQQSALMPEAIPSSPTQILGLPPLKAVLVVGPLDEDGPLTTREKANMNTVAEELEAHGVTVHKFYTPNNDWTQIKAAARGAHFFLYRGHGVYRPPMPYPTVGGLYLKDGFILPDTIRNDMALAPGAIVMLYGCFSAGTSALDEGEISSQEASRRVSQYSAPFIDVGAAGYYANWYDDAFQQLVRSLFQGMTLGQAYESFYDFDEATVERHPYPDQPGLSMWLDKDHWWEAWQYNYAFVGQPDQTLQSLFGLPEMEVKPSGIVHMADPTSSPQTFKLNVGNTGPGEFSWTAMLAPKARWLDAKTLSGTSGQDLSIVVDPTGKKPGTYQIDIRIVAGEPSVQNGDQTVSITLYIRKELHRTYLPTIRSSAP